MRNFAPILRRPIGALLNFPTTSSVSASWTSTAKILKFPTAKKNLNFLREKRNFSHQTLSSSTFMDDSGPPRTDNLCEIESWAEHVIQREMYRINTLPETAMAADTTKFELLVDSWFDNVVEVCNATHGIRLLIKLALDPPPSKPDDTDVMREKIGKIWDGIGEQMRASDFLALLIMDMLERGHIDDAMTFAKLFTIHGASFVRPLLLLVWRAEEVYYDEKLRHLLPMHLVVVELLAKLVQECYFDAQKVRRKPKRKKKEAEEGGGGGDQEQKPVEEVAEEEEDETDDRMLVEATRYRPLLWIWIPARMRLFLRSKASAKYMKRRRKAKRMHRVDPEGLAKLGQALITAWAQLATRCVDSTSWERLQQFAERNRITLDEQMAKDWERRWMAAIATEDDDEDGDDYY